MSKELTDRSKQLEEVANKSTQSEVVADISNLKFVLLSQE